MPSDMYNTKESTYFSQNRLEMLPFIPATANRLLEVGCGRGGFISALKQQREVYAVWIEPLGGCSRCGAAAFLCTAHDLI